MRKWLTWLHRANSGDLSEVTDQGGLRFGITLNLVNYNKDEIVSIEDISPADCPTYLKTGQFTWIHVQGQPKPSLLRELGELFSLHPLALEDAINIGERSKTEVYENQIVVILGMPIKRGLKIVNEQITLFLGENFLISISNGSDDPFKAVRRRLESSRSLLRQRSVDYLLYVLVDVIVDHSFPFLEEFQEEIEAVEKELQGKESVSTFKTLYYIKRELLIFRLKLRPQRETVRVLMRDDSGLLSEETKIYLRDCHDHMIRLIDIIEIYHDLITNMLDVHLTLANEVQRKATVISVLLSTVTYITGIYGMNLLIPESNWHLGYPFALGLMAISAIVLTIFFKRKHWL
jgi:magnesium transporter